MFFSAPDVDSTVWLINSENGAVEYLGFYFHLISVCYAPASHTTLCQRPETLTLPWFPTHLYSFFLPSHLHSTHHPECSCSSPFYPNSLLLHRFPCPSQVSLAFSIFGQPPVKGVKISALRLGLLETSEWGLILQMVARVKGATN